MVILLQRGKITSVTSELTFKRLITMTRRERWGRDAPLFLLSLRGRGRPVGHVVSRILREKHCLLTSRKYGVIVCIWVYIYSKIDSKKGGEHGSKA